MNIHDSDGGEPSSVTPVPDDTESNPGVVRRTIRARSREIKHQELQRAFDQFQAHGRLTSTSRAPRKSWMDGLHGRPARIDSIEIDILSTLKREDSFVGQQAGPTSPKAP